MVAASLPSAAAPLPHLCSPSPPLQPPPPTSAAPHLCSPPHPPLQPPSPTSAVPPTSAPPPLQRPPSPAQPSPTGVLAPTASSQAELITGPSLAPLNAAHSPGLGREGLTLGCRRSGRDYPGRARRGSGRSWRCSGCTRWAPAEKGGRGCQVRSGEGLAAGVGDPRPHLVPHRLPAQQGDICLLHLLGVLELPVGHAAALRAGRGRLQGTGHSPAEAARVEGGQAEAGSRNLPRTHRPAPPATLFRFQHTLPSQRLGLHPPQGLRYPDSPHPSGPAQAPNPSPPPLTPLLLPGSPAAHPGAQNPLIHSAEASLPLGAPGHLGQELVPLRHRAAAGGRSRPPPCPNCSQTPTVGTGAPPRPAHMKVRHGEKVRFAGAPAGKQGLRRGRRSSVSEPARAAAPAGLSANGGDWGHRKGTGVGG